MLSGGFRNHVPMGYQYTQDLMVAVMVLLMAYNHDEFLHTCDPSGWNGIPVKYEELSRTSQAFIEGEFTDGPYKALVRSLRKQIESNRRHNKAFLDGHFGTTEAGNAFDLFKAFQDDRISRLSGVNEGAAPLPAWMGVEFQNRVSATLQKPSEIQ